MIQSFKNLSELFVVFPDDESCRKHYEAIRWRNGRKCPNCKHYKTYELKGGKTYKCASCRKRFTVTVGTIFDNTKVGLRLWFAAIYLATSHKKGISSIQLAKDIGVTQKTAWFMLHRIREMLREKAPQMLTDTVEVDETYIGGKGKNKHKNKRLGSTFGRSLKDKAPVFGMLQRGGKVIAMPVETTSGARLKPEIQKYVSTEAIVYTDEWSAYRKLHHTHQHRIIKHKQGQYVVGDVHTNTIEGFWSQFKRGITGIYHQVSSKHLGRYCDEFTFRYNYRKMKEDERFNLALTESNTILRRKNLCNGG